MIAIKTQLIPAQTQRRSGIKIAGVSFLCMHDTGNNGTTAQQNVNYFINSANEMQASAHYFVDDKQIICCVPETEKAWHVRYDVPKDNELFGKDANDWAIGIELCFDSNNTNVKNIQAYTNYIDLTADLCFRYKLDPKKHIVGHYLLDPSRRTDPLNAFRYINKTWVDFVNDVSFVMTPVATPPAHPDTIKLKALLAELQTVVNKYQ